MVLVDAGPIVAILNRNDRFHAQTVSQLQSYRAGALLTTWPVIGEACSLVPENRQHRVLDWIRLQGVEIWSIDAGLDFMHAQLANYADLPCDFADASLLFTTWQSRVRDIWTLDKDFLVYRLPDRSRFKVIAGGKV